ncbi:hypothetical protein U9M48_036781 [Paspalum notatum var. saurae]|uniref:Uncharacterized protein n=1 Tax=Paspalum notatum var. saurae TaxID=547442 RepID=A0AAQ3UDR4_PASNO
MQRRRRQRQGLGNSISVLHGREGVHHPRVASRLHAPARPRLAPVCGPALRSPRPAVDLAPRTSAPTPVSAATPAPGLTARVPAPRCRRASLIHADCCLRSPRRHNSASICTISIAPARPCHCRSRCAPLPASIRAGANRPLGCSPTPTSPLLQSPVARRRRRLRWPGSSRLLHIVRAASNLAAAAAAHPLGAQWSHPRPAPSAREPLAPTSSDDGTPHRRSACRSHLRPAPHRPPRPRHNRRALLLTARGSPLRAGRRRLSDPSVAAVADQISSRSNRRSHQVVVDVGTRPEDATRLQFVRTAAAPGRSISRSKDDQITRKGGFGSWQLSAKMTTFLLGLERPSHESESLRLGV